MKDATYIYTHTHTSVHLRGTYLEAASHCCIISERHIVRGRTQSTNARQWLTFSINKMYRISLRPLSKKML